MIRPHREADETEGQDHRRFRPARSRNMGSAFNVREPISPDGKAPRVGGIQATDIVEVAQRARPQHSWAALVYFP